MREQGPRQNTVRGSPAPPSVTLLVGLGVYGLGVWGLGFRGFGFRVWGLG